MPRLAVVTDYMTLPHGTEMLTALVIDEAVRRGWDVVLFAAYFDARKSSWSAFLQQRGVLVFHPGFWLLTRYHLPQRVLAWRFWRYVRRHRLSLVWAPTNDPLVCRVLEAIPTEAPPVVVHDPGDASEACPHYSRLWFEHCGRVTALSVHGKRQAASAQRYYQMDSPIRSVWPACFPPAPDIAVSSLEAPLRFGQFGRLYSMKGALFSVAALARVREMGCSAELHLFGDGPFAPIIKELVDSLGVSEFVVFHGAYKWEDLDRLTENVDVGLMPSIYEGFGLVMLELMARGRPVISTDVGSSREVLEGLGGGWVVRRADTEELARLMARCCENPKLVREMGHQAKRVWERHFTPAHMFDRHIAFWRDCGIDV